MAANAGGRQAARRERGASSFDRPLTATANRVQGLAHLVESLDHRDERVEMHRIDCLLKGRRFVALLLTRDVQATNQTVQIRLRMDSVHQ